jgi:surfeit locus 1 family protein
MSLRIGRREFAPRAWAVAATLLVVAACVALGGWQLRRGQEKQALVAAFADGTATSIELQDVVTVDGLPRYQRVRATGAYDSTHQVLIDNMPSQAGKPGYRVLTPFRRDGSDTLLLVDRGWVPLGTSRSVLPAVSVSSGHRAVSGQLDTLPEPGVRVGAAGVPGDRSWPRVLNFPRQQDVEQALGERVESRIVLLDPAAPDGFERAWRPAMRFGPERHLGYAVQWFALALALLVAFVALSLRPRDDAADTKTMDSTA